MNIPIRRCISLAVVGAALAVGVPAVSAASYPERPVRVVIPYPPGAAGDIALRQVQPLLEKELGQPLVIDYRTGAGGNIGVWETVRAKPDGYTLVLGATNNFVINQFLYKDLNFDPLADLTPIGRLADVPAFVYVNETVPAEDFASLQTYLQAHPGKLNYGSPGTGTAPHLSAFMLTKAMDADMMHVPYRGAAPGVLGLLANEVQLYIGGYSVAAAYLQDGRVRPLAVAARQRFTALPDVPTMEELGMPDVVLSNWWALAAPAGTPAPIIDRLSNALNAVLGRPEMRERFAEMGFVAEPVPPASFADELREQAQAWKRIVQESEVTLDD